MPKIEDFKAMNSKIGNCGHSMVCFKLRSGGQCPPAHYYCKELEPVYKAQCELSFTVLVNLVILIQIHTFAGISVHVVRLMWLAFSSYSNLLCICLNLRLYCLYNLDGYNLSQFKAI